LGIVLGSHYSLSFDMSVGRFQVIATLTEFTNLYLWLDYVWWEMKVHFQIRKHFINKPDFSVTLLHLWVSRDALSPVFFFLFSLFGRLVSWFGFTLTTTVLLFRSFLRMPTGPALTQKGNRVRGLSPRLHRWHPLLSLYRFILSQSRLRNAGRRICGVFLPFHCADISRNVKCKTLSSFLIFKKLVLPVGFNILPLYCF